MVALPAPSRFEPKETPDAWPPASIRESVERSARLTAAGMLQAALEEDLRAAELAPDDSYVQNNLGVTLANLERKEQALEQFKRAVQLSPEHPGFTRHMAFALTELGRAREALDAVRTLHHPAMVEARRIIVKYELDRLVKTGSASWSGGKPKGSEHPVKLSPGPSITELVHEGRR